MHNKFVKIFKESKDIEVNFETEASFCFTSKCDFISVTSSIELVHL